MAELHTPIDELRERLTGLLADWGAELSMVLRELEKKRERLAELEADAERHDEQLESLNKRLEGQEGLIETLSADAEEAFKLRREVQSKDLEIERLQSENLSLFPDRAMRAYGEHGDGAAAKPTVETPAHLQPALEDLFFLDPGSISRELGIKSKNKPEDLDRARRSFAMRYHPDRVPEEYRERAVLRMQIANMLIDEAKRAKR